ncbi:hypothetical protein M758_6G064900 [Ceratodon purpureus]|nr:hypothetical protein M758_6G064900 [Ceratodon purpureus]
MEVNQSLILAPWLAAPILFVTVLEWGLPVEYENRSSTHELNKVLREFEKCGTIIERVTGPDGANWVQLQYQSPREAGQALMKSGLRLKGGLQVVVRSLDERQRRQLLLETISKDSNRSMGRSSTYMPASSGPVDLDAPKEEEGPPKSSVSKFVDLVFDCERNYQISPAGYIIPISFEPGLYKELFKSQVHRCDAFVTPLCDPAANQPLYFEYPRKSVDPCAYAQNKLDELRTMVEEELASDPRATFRPTGDSVCGGSAWRGSDFQCESQQRFCGCTHRSERPQRFSELPESPE